MQKKKNVGRKTKRVPSKTGSNVVNVKTLMKENAYVEKKGVRRYLNVSPESIQEMRKRVVEAFEDNMPQIACIATNDGRSTVMTRHYPGVKPDICDVTMHFGLLDSKIINESSDKYMVVGKKVYYDLLRRVNNSSVD